MTPRHMKLVALFTGAVYDMDILFVVGRLFNGAEWATPKAPGWWEGLFEAGRFNDRKLRGYGSRNLMLVPIPKYLRRVNPRRNERKAEKHGQLDSRL